ncbi:MAG: MFS transporter [Candidatus Synoicihabitans palmerolidicus]|nr:MFS transporter [Candidatus Synoicihabitans palmerolidicus]
MPPSKALKTFNATPPASPPPSSVPRSEAYGRDLLSQDYAGSFLLVAGLLLFGLITFQFFREPPRMISNAVSDVRPLATIVRSPHFIIASLTAAIGFGVMSFIMTATPINMHEICGIGLIDTKRVIQAHILAMFSPSLISGWLMNRFGISRMIAVGTGIFGAVLCIGLLGRELIHFWGSLVLLGIGWNLLFVGGTALLPACYAPSERYKVQATNDLVVFGSQAIASLSAGWFLFSFGWNVLLLSCIPFILIALARWQHRVDLTPESR